ncbi:winged helix-turn-helix domain-containing protein [Mesorhizobium sp. M0976]|uniref:winged helix-turn-helix domain-containing tetratricopeptide repeat protein n=1 Tax=Mesorhizobium sp. M0976 TaxID=2957038 RepID=UPI0033368035
MPGSATDQVFQFGGFTLDLGKGTLGRAEQPAFLRPKAYALLTHLARHIGRVVPKSELMDAVWPGVFVTEDSLTQSIREIRKVLGEETIRTVSKRGYMLMPEIEPVPEPGAQPIVAVLRFRNDSADPADEAIVDRIAEDIINGLARFDTLTGHGAQFELLVCLIFAQRMACRTLAHRRRLSRRGFGAAAADSIVCAVNLVDAASASQLWGDRYQANYAGLSAIQQEIVEKIVGRLVVRVNNAGLQRASRQPVASLAARELVLRGVALLRDPAQSELKEAAAFFEAAIVRDPAYGLAYTYLALSHVLNSEFGPISDAVLTKARDLADRGIALSPDQATAHRIQSLVRLNMREHEAAEHHLRIALELNPGDADCIEQMGHLLTMRGRPLDALAWLVRAIRINPLHPHWYQYDRALALYMLGEYRTAAEALELATRPTPWIRTRLAACYAQFGDMQAARRQAALINADGSDFSPLDYARAGTPFENASDAEHLADGVSLALGYRSKS